MHADHFSPTMEKTKAAVVDFESAGSKMVDLFICGRSQADATRLGRIILFKLKHVQAGSQ
jgi:hypothetical protein